MAHTQQEGMIMTEHPFAPYIRIIGKGKNGARPLTEDEAYHAMQMIMAEAVSPEQLGAFMMLMRMKEETAPELAGFVRAIKEAMILPQQSQAVDLDWSSYAGKRRYLPWFLLSALLLAENGVRVFMHGNSGHTAGRLYTDEVLHLFGFSPAPSFSDALHQIAQHNFSYMSLAQLSPKLAHIMAWRHQMGLRLPVHTVVRLLNPFNADYLIQGIFHPGYRPVHQQAAALLGQAHMAVLKGDGGEIERNPDMPCLVQSLHHGELSNEEWPEIFGKRHVKEGLEQPERLLALWRGELLDEFPTQTVMGTTAVVLKLLGKAQSQDEAHSLAQEWWSQRDKNRFV
jgi:anthranilate phosphoribosyltransferase